MNDSPTDQPEAPKGEETQTPTPAKDKKSAKRCRPRRGKWCWCRRVVCVLVLLAVTAALVLIYITRPKTLTPWMANVLSEATGSEVQVGLARVSLGGKLTLENVSVDVPGVPEQRREFARLFEAEQITVQIDRSVLWKFQLKAEQIEVVQPQLHLIEDVDQGRLNLEMLALPQSDGDGQRLPVRLPPSLDMSDARVRFAQMRDGEFETIDEMRLEGELKEDRGQPGVYHFELRQTVRGVGIDSRLVGSLDLENVGFTLTLDGFSVDQPHRYLVPYAFRDLWDRLDPAGGLPRLAITMDSTVGGRLKLKDAVLELEDVSITPPYDELGLNNQTEDGLPGYAPRMHDVSGRLVVDRQQLQVRELSGQIEGIRYFASGHWPLSKEGSGTLRVSTDPFDISRDPRFLGRLPTLGAKIYDRLSPRGRFQANVRFDKPTGDAPTQAHGVVALLDVAGVYHQFPYPLENITGHVEFGPDAVRIRELRGTGPNGGSIRIDGIISPPGDAAGVRIDIAASGMGVDEHLMGALKEDERDAVEMFMDRAGHKRLVEKGLIRSGLPELNALSPADAPAAPRFDLGGKPDVSVLVHRPVGPDQRYSVTTTIDVAGVNALYRPLQYPLTIDSGRIVISRGLIEVQELNIQGLSGGQAIVDGAIKTPPGQKTEYPNLDIRDATFPLDRYLVHAIPGDAGRGVADLHLNGELFGSGRVFRDDDQAKTDWLFDFTLKDGSARPYAGQYDIQQLTGRGILDRRSLTLSDITGQNRDTPIQLLARFDWSTKPTTYNLNLATQNLAVEPSLLDLVPPGSEEHSRLVAINEKFKPKGIVDAKIRWALTLPEDAGITAQPVSTFTLEAQPKTFAFTHRDQRLTFNDMTGEVAADMQQVDLRNLAGQSEHGNYQIDGIVGLNKAIPTTLTFSCQGHTDDPYARAFAPSAVVQTLDAMSLAGDYHLHDARLLLQAADPDDDSQNIVEFDGQTRFSKSRADIGVPITGFEGELITRVRRSPSDDQPVLDFDLRGKTMRVFERLVQPLNVTMTNRERADRLAFTNLMAGVYGGLLVGEGSVPFTKGEPTRLQLTLSGVAADPILKPELYDPTHPKHHAAQEGTNSLASVLTSPFSNLKRDTQNGSLSASLTIESFANDPDKNRGRGVLNVTEATLYNRPIATALLRATNLGLPSGSPLDNASARFLVDGQTVIFDSVSFDGPGLRIAGSGTMTLPDNQLDLVLVSRNTRLKNLGPITDLINVFKDQLITIQLRGTPGKPQANIITLSSFRQSWQQLFNDTSANPNPDDNLVNP